MEQNIEIDNLVDDESKVLLELLKNNSEYLNVIDDDEIKLNTLLNFVDKIAENQKNIDSEIVDLVNENFWELI